MAWALLLNGSTDRLILSKAFTALSTDDWSLKFSLIENGSQSGTFYRFMSESTDFGGGRIIMNEAGTQFRYGDGILGELTISALSFNLDDIFEFRNTLAGGFQFLINDIVVYSNATNRGCNLGVLGWNGGTYGNFGVIYANFVNSTVSANSVNLDATLSDHSASSPDQPELLDTVAGNNAIGEGFTNLDGSVWVDLGGGASYTLAIDSGIYSYSGVELPLIYNKVLPVNGAVYSYAGAELDLAYSQLTNYALSIDGGIYNYSGQSIPLLYNRSMPISGGDYSYTGGSVTLSYSESNNYSLTVTGGDYGYISDELTLLYSRKIAVDGGTYSYDGSIINTIHNRLLSADGESYNYTGAELPLSYNRSLSTVGGGYEYTGAQITLTYSGQITLLIDCYSVEFKQDDVTLSYSQDNYGIEYGCL